MEPYASWLPSWISKMSYVTIIIDKKKKSGDRIKRKFASLT